MSEPQYLGEARHSETLERLAILVDQSEECLHGFWISPMAAGAPKIAPAACLMPRGKPTHRHYKGDTMHRIGDVVTTLHFEPHVLYWHNNEIWARPYAMFHEALPDGRLRFEPLCPPPINFSPASRTASVIQDVPENDVSAMAAQVMAGFKAFVYPDGACSGNPGPGGWGVVIKMGSHATELSGGEAETTNNRMELMGAIAGLKALPTGSTAEVHTDSQYVQKGMSEWIAGWKRRGWRTGANEPVKNEDLWRQLDAAAGRHKQVTWHWVKGHAGHPENERADQLACAARGQQR